jgi:hypothetical protein
MVYVPRLRGLKYTQEGLTNHNNSVSIAAFARVSGLLEVKWLHLGHL